MKNYFKKHEFLNFPARPSDLERFLLSRLALNMNVIRQEIGAPMIITDCYRRLAKYVDMLARGLYPSATSDHFFGQAIQCKKPALIKKYGPIFTMSAGAADFVVRGRRLFDVFKEIVSMAEKKFIDIGQVIYERRPRRRGLRAAEWIHLSNPRTLIFDTYFLKYIGGIKTKYLTSKTGGRTYQVYRP